MRYEIALFSLKINDVTLVPPEKKICDQRKNIFFLYKSTT
jgi:hypothetical protein